MNKTKKYVANTLAGLMVAWSISTATPAFAQKKPEPVKDKIERTLDQEVKVPVSFSAYVTALSKYNEEGLDGYPYTNAPVLQPEFFLGIGDAKNRLGTWSVNFWGNHDTDLDKLTETEVTLDITKAWEPITVSIGFLRTEYLDVENEKVRFDREAIDEVYAGFTLNKVPLKPSASFYNVTNGDGKYLDFSLSTEIFSKLFDNKNHKGWKLDLSALVGYSDKYYGDDKGFTHFELYGDLNIPISKNVELNPDIRYSKSLDVDGEIYGRPGYVEFALRIPITIPLSDKINMYLIPYAAYSQLLDDFYGLDKEQKAVGISIGIGGK